MPPDGAHTSKASGNSNISGGTTPRQAMEQERTMVDPYDSFDQDLGQALLRLAHEQPSRPGQPQTDTPRRRLTTRTCPLSSSRLLSSGFRIMQSKQKRRKR